MNVLMTPRIYGGTVSRSEMTSESIDIYQSAFSLQGSCLAGGYVNCLYILFDDRSDVQAATRPACILTSKRFHYSWEEICHGSRGYSIDTLKSALLHKKRLKWQQGQSQEPRGGFGFRVWQVSQIRFQMRSRGLLVLIHAEKEYHLKNVSSVTTLRGTKPNYQNIRFDILKG